MKLNDALPIALEFLGDSLPPEFRWQHGIRCPIAVATGCLYTNCPNCDAEQVEWTPMDDGSYRTVLHDVPCPEITDALAMAMLRALATLNHAPELYISQADNHWYCEIFTQSDHVISPLAADPAEAIVRAVAALAEQQKSVNARRPS